MLRALIVLLCLVSSVSAVDLQWSLEAQTWLVSASKEAYIKKDGSHTGFYVSDSDYEWADSLTDGWFVLSPNANFTTSLSRDAGVATAEVKENEPKIHAEYSSIGMPVVSTYEFTAYATNESDAATTTSGTPIYECLAYGQSQSTIASTIDVWDSNALEFNKVKVYLSVNANMSADYGNRSTDGYAKAVLEDTWVKVERAWHSTNNRYEWKVTKKLRGSDGAWVVATAPNESVHWYGTATSVNVLETSYKTINRYFDIEGYANSGTEYCEARALTAGQTGAEDHSKAACSVWASVEILDVYW
jgi:hypothetical protein